MSFVEYQAVPASIAIQINLVGDLLMSFKHTPISKNMSNLAVSFLERYPDYAFLKLKCPLIN